jgi:hypothetical protein
MTRIESRTMLRDFVTSEGGDEERVNAQVVRFLLPNTRMEIITIKEADESIILEWQFTGKELEHGNRIEVIQEELLSMTGPYTHGRGYHIRKNDLSKLDKYIEVETTVGTINSDGVVAGSQKTHSGWQEVSGSITPRSITKVTIALDPTKVDARALAKAIQNIANRIEELAN